ncbi:UDP-glucuronic acid decarboxylase 1, partial [Xenotaenia resolanae]
GNPEEHTILEFAQLIKSLVVSRSQIQFLSEAQDDPQRRRPDIRKAKMMLGWEPVVSSHPHTSSLVVDIKVALKLTCLIHGGFLP